MRSNNTDLEGIVNYYANQAVQNYINSQTAPEKTYSIDEYSDEELYMADLKARFPDFTDEEIEAKLDTAKLNEETFKKEVDSLRSYYKAEEDAVCLMQLVISERFFWIQKILTETLWK